MAIIQHLPRTWMVNSASSDLPDLKNLQPTDHCAYGADHMSSLPISTQSSSTREVPAHTYFSCLHDCGRPGSGSAAGRPKTCSESRNLQKVIGSSSSNPQTSRPDEQEQQRKILPPKVIATQSYKVHRLTMCEYIPNNPDQNT